MKKFIFPLERLRGLRQSLLEAEQARMLELMTSIVALEERRTALEKQELHAMDELRRKAVIAVDELEAVAGFRRYAGKEKLRMRAEASSLQSRLERQRQTLLDAQREVESLNRLRERRLDQWRTELDRETENTVAELVIARWRQGGEPA